MGVIIGSGTTVVIDGTDLGFQSIQWSTQVQANRLWQLGSWNMYKTQVTKTLTVSVTTYASVLNAIALEPNQSCSNSTAMKNIRISSQCGSSSSISIEWDDMFLNSYSYSKGDPTAFGTESWQFQKWVDAEVDDEDYINVGAPTYTIQGTSEGSYSGNVTNLGIVLQTAGRVTGSQGSVSAGPGSTGQADDTIYGIVTQVGGGTLQQSGKVGQSSASIPHQPLYLG